MKVVVDNQRQPSGQSTTSSYWRKRNDKVITMDVKRANPQQSSPYRSTTANQNVFASQTEGSFLTPNRSKSPSQFYQPNTTEQKRDSVVAFSLNDTTDIEALKKENARLKQTVETQQERIRVLEKELARHESRDVERDSMLGRYSDNSRKVSQLEDELTQVHKQLRNLEYELESKKKEINDKDREKAVVESTIIDKDRKIKDWESKENEARREAEEKKREAEERKKKLSEIEEEKRKLHSRVEELEVTHKRQLGNLNDDKDKLEKEIKDLKEKLSSIEKSNQEKEYVLSRMFSQISDLNKTKSQIENGPR